MEHFQYRDGELYAENVPVEQIAQEYGTPAYIYSRAAFEERYQAYDEALKHHPHLICYAVKANSNLAVLDTLARLGAGFDIVSVGELERVLRVGGDPAKVVFSGVGKQPTEMRRALEVGVRCFNVESEAELFLLNDVAREAGQKAPVSIRVNPDVDARTHPYISTGLKDNKFGVDINRADELYKKAADLAHLQILGVDCHIGSQLTEVTPFLDALDRVLALIDRLAAAGIEIRHLDLGGGLGVRYRDETPPDPATYMQAVLDRIKGRELELVLEPGRSIAANAGIMITRVLALKCSEHRNFAIIDGAMNDLIRPALYSAWQDIVAVRPRNGDDARPYDIVGPVCETGDFLGKGRELDLAPDDLLAVCSAGAYGFVMSSNYNSRSRPPELLVDGSNVYLARRRENFEDQVALESGLPKGD